LVPSTLNLDTEPIADQSTEHGDDRHHNPPPSYCPAERSDADRRGKYQA